MENLAWSKRRDHFTSAESVMVRIHLLAPANLGACLIAAISSKYWNSAMIPVFCRHFARDKAKLGVMKRWLVLFLCWVCPALSQEAEDDPRLYFAGGTSEISSSDKKRAKKAIAKWSAEGAFAEAPYFWDSSVVGKHLFIRIIKNSNREGELEVWVKCEKEFELYKIYRIAFFSGKLGPKKKQGDQQAPEGFYYINRKRMNPKSRYHLSMNMGYPNAYDRDKKYTGDHLMIHGSRFSVGCYAMTDNSIEQIYTLVDAALKNGQGVVRVHSFPFRMTDENLEEHKESPHYEFWLNLKQGWDWFETHKTPPNVEVEQGRYVFEELKVN